MSRGMFETAFSNYTIDYGSSSETTPNKRKKRRPFDPLSVTPLTAKAALDHLRYLVGTIERVQSEGGDDSAMQRRADEIWTLYQELNRNDANRT